jgi:hypothetical protein
MTGWITHIVAFLLGGVAGAIFVSRRAGGGSGSQDPRKSLQRVYRESPKFFDDLRDELDRPEFRHVREFAILESSRVTFVSENLRFVYYEEDIPDLRALATRLEDLGYLDEVSPGKTPIFRLRENFVEALKAL